MEKQVANVARFGRTGSPGQPQLLEGCHDPRLVFHVGQWLQIRRHVLLVQGGALADYYRLGIEDIAWPEREELEDNQILGRAGSQGGPSLQFE
jgi:hypothetical protein